MIVNNSVELLIKNWKSSSNRYFSTRRSHLKDTTSKPAKSKAQINREQVLAELDAADAAVPQNPQKHSGEINGSADDSFIDMFESSLNERSFNVGDIVTGIISDVHEDFVLVDINYKSEGLIPTSEFRLVNGQSQIEKGSEVEVYIDRIENENGMVVLSKNKADMSRAWNDISKAAENEEVIEGTVVAKVKGGTKRRYWSHSISTRKPN